MGPRKVLEPRRWRTKLEQGCGRERERVGREQRGITAVKDRGDEECEEAKECAERENELWSWGWISTAGAGSSLVWSGRDVVLQKRRIPGSNE